LIIPRMAAIADFKQRWRQRGKTPDCSFNQMSNYYYFFSNTYKI